MTTPNELKDIDFTLLAKAMHEGTQSLSDELERQDLYVIYDRQDGDIKILDLESTIAGTWLTDTLPLQKHVEAFVRLLQNEVAAGQINILELSDAARHDDIPLWGSEIKWLPLMEAASALTFDRLPLLASVLRQQGLTLLLSEEDGEAVGLQVADPEDEGGEIVDECDELKAFVDLLNEKLIMSSEDPDAQEFSLSELPPDVYDYAEYDDESDSEEDEADEDLSDMIGEDLEISGQGAIAIFAANHRLFVDYTGLTVRPDHLQFRSLNTIYNVYAKKDADGRPYFQVEALRSTELGIVASTTGPCGTIEGAIMQMKHMINPDLDEDVVEEDKDEDEASPD